MTEDLDPVPAPPPAPTGGNPVGLDPRLTPSPGAGPGQGVVEGGAERAAPIYPVATTPASPGRRRRRRRWPWITLILVVVALATASRWNLDYYAVQPGSAQSVQQFIKVPPGRGHPVRHPVLLTDVEIGRVTALSYLFYRLQGDTSLESVDAVTGGTPPSQLDAQGNLEMSQAEASAKTSALRRLGYPVTATASGAVIFGTYPGTPAYSVLNVGDVITAVDGTATPTARDLTTALHHFHSGQSITLSVRRGGTGGPAPVSVTLENTKVDLGGGQTTTLDLGIQPEDQVDYTYPFPVGIDVTNIGGPSAGLAMSLGVIDALTSGSVTGGHTVAATGTIDSQGDVGDVGGVAQKTVAVENAGASIFLVPRVEYKTAMAKDRPGLSIYAVSTLDQALAVLAAHGGSVPGTAPSSPAAGTVG